MYQVYVYIYIYYCDIYLGYRLIKVCALVKLIRKAANAKKGLNPKNP